MNGGNSLLCLQSFESELGEIRNTMSVDQVLVVIHSLRSLIETRRKSFGRRSYSAHIICDDRKDCELFRACHFLVERLCDIRPMTVRNKDEVDTASIQHSASIEFSPTIRLYITEMPIHADETTARN